MQDRGGPARRPQHRRIIPGREGGAAGRGGRQPPGFGGAALPAPNLVRAGGEARPSPGPGGTIGLGRGGDRADTERDRHPGRVAGPRRSTGRADPLQFRSFSEQIPKLPIPPLSRLPAGPGRAGCASGPGSWPLAAAVVAAAAAAETPPDLLHPTRTPEPAAVMESGPHAGRGAGAAPGRHACMHACKREPTQGRGETEDAALAASDSCRLPHPGLGTHTGEAGSAGNHPPRRPEFGGHHSARAQVSPSLPGPCPRPEPPQMARSRVCTDLGHHLSEPPRSASPPQSAILGGRLGLGLDMCVVGCPDSQAWGGGSPACHAAA